MRQHVSLDLGERRLVTVRELRVGGMRHLLALLTPERLDRPSEALLADLLPELLTLADESLALPRGETLDDLSASEVVAIGTAWWGLHRDFLQRALALLGLLVPSAPAPEATPPAPSSAPVSGSSSADCPTPGTGAGASSCAPLS